MSNTVKASIFDIKISADNLLLVDKTLEDILKEVSSKLDDNDSINTRILEYLIQMQMIKKPQYGLILSTIYLIFQRKIFLVIPCAFY